jgi:hypothetical protein
MKTLITSNASGLSSLLFYAALAAHGTTGCSSKVNGFVSMGGDTGGSAVQPVSGTAGNSNASATGGAPTSRTSLPITGGESAAGGTGYAQGGASAAAGGAYLVTTSVGVVRPTCTGTYYSQQQLAAIGQAFQQNSNCRGGGMLGEPAMVSLLLLVDASEAMAQPVRDTTIWRWDVVEQGILGFVEKYSQGTLQIAVGFYGAYRESTSIANCDLDAYVSPAISMDRLANNAANIGSHFDGMRSKLNAPATLYPALTGALAFALGWQKSYREQRTAVVLVTDGRTQICNATLADDRELVQTYATSYPDMPTNTFVIGVDGDPANLDVIAEGGGTTRAYLVDGPVASEQFTASLENIVDTLRAAFVPSVRLGNALSTEPAYMLVHDYTLGTYLVPQVNSAADCNTDRGGWYFTLDSSGQALATFCPCSRPNGNAADLSWYYGCPLPFSTD